MTRPMIETSTLATHPRNSVRHLIMTIQPKCVWLGLNMRELWSYRELLILATRNIKLCCKQKVLGAAWANHTLGFAAPVVAVTPGSDSTFSPEPDEFKAMVDAIRIVEKTFGKISNEVTEQESASRVFRRPNFIIKVMKTGDEFSKEYVRFIRPDSG